MTFDITAIYADIASTAAVALMIWIIKIQSNQDHRIQRIENDLYVENGNPTSLPLTKQVFNLQQDVKVIKDGSQKLQAAMDTINTTMERFIAECMKVTKKTKKKV